MNKSVPIRIECVESGKQGAVLSDALKGWIYTYPDGRQLHQASYSCPCCRKQEIKTWDKRIGARMIDVIAAYSQVTEVELPVTGAETKPGEAISQNEVDRATVLLQGLSDFAIMQKIIED